MAGPYALLGSRRLKRATMDDSRGLAAPTARIEFFGLPDAELTAAITLAGMTLAATAEAEAQLTASITLAGMTLAATATDGSTPTGSKFGRFGRRRRRGR